MITVIMMRVTSLLTAVCVVACQGERRADVDALTDAERRRIEEDVRQVVEEIFAAARATDAERLFALRSEEDGICLTETRMLSCDEAEEDFRQGWSSDRPDRLQRQEVEGREIEVMAIRPDVAVAAVTTDETRGHLATGEVARGRDANFMVLVRERGGWKYHSAQHAYWSLPRHR